MNDYEFYGKAIDRLDDIRDGQIGLRDYFAAKAMQAMVASQYDVNMRGYEGWREDFGREAYRYADAMLAAREQTPWP